MRRRRRTGAVPARREAIGTATASDTVGELARRLAARAATEVDVAAIAERVEADVADNLATRRGSVTGTEREAARMGAERAAAAALLAIQDGLA